jgi:hypothetical protein
MRRYRGEQARRPTGRHYATLDRQGTRQRLRTRTSETTRRKQTTNHTPQSGHRNKIRPADVPNPEAKKGHPPFDYAATQRRLVGSKTDAARQAAQQPKRTTKDITGNMTGHPHEAPTRPPHASQKKAGKTTAHEDKPLEEGTTLNRTRPPGAPAKVAVNGRRAAG